MVKTSVSNENLFKIHDESTDKIYFGCTQEWYPDEWQRRAGCGPTTACNLILYRNRRSLSEDSLSSKEASLAQMEELWQFVTPTNHGVNTTKLFYESLDSYIKAKGLDAGYHFLDVPKEEAKRPAFKEVLNFIKDALAKDEPVAFLNLCNGDEKNLDRWHWVTIISVEYSDEEDSAFISILDEGIVKIIDLELWYRTTTLGGGFVYLK